MTLKEMIVVNHISHKDKRFIMKMWRNNSWDNHLESLGEGCYGKVYAYKNFAIKVFKDKLGYKNNMDPHILLQLNNEEYFPTLFSYIENELMVIERVEGTPMNEIIYQDNPDIELNEETMYYLEKSLRHIFSKSLIPEDVAGCNIVINKNNFPIIIDVGSFSPYNKDINKEEYISKKLLILNSEINFQMANKTLIAGM